MLSPAQPASPASLSGTKMHNFALFFSSKVFKEREIVLFQNRKNKILSGPNIVGERIQNAPFFVRHRGANRASVEQSYSVNAYKVLVLFSCFLRSNFMNFHDKIRMAPPLGGVRYTTN